MIFGKSPEIVPSTEKSMREGAELPDSATNIGSVKLLYQQIDQILDAISARRGSKDPADKLKNQTDKRMIDELQEKIKNIRNGKEEEEVEELKPEEEPYLK